MPPSATNATPHTRAESLLRTDVPITDVYDIHRRHKLGHGASGSVFRGTHKATNEEVAVKVMVCEDDEGAGCVRACVV